MRRRQAARLFREICEREPEAFVSKVSLVPKRDSKNEFALRINASLSSQSIDRLKFLVAKHGLRLHQDQESIIIYENSPVQKEVRSIARNWKRTNQNKMPSVRRLVVMIRDFQASRAWDVLTENSWSVMKTPIVTFCACICHPCNQKATNLDWLNSWSEPRLLNYNLDNELLEPYCLKQTLFQEIRSTISPLLELTKKYLHLTKLNTKRILETLWRLTKHKSICDCASSITYQTIN